MSSENPRTRERILKSCWELLESGQPAATRMSDIAKRAGISRQAVYLHFPKRAELLIETTRYIDKVKDVESRLLGSRQAQTGVERLDSFIEAWGAYIPEIYGVIKALMAMKDTDAEAASAWHDRMDAVRQGCHAAVDALEADGMLSATLNTKEATDLMWTLLSVRNWEQLTLECGWPQDVYIKHIKNAARCLLID